MGVASTAGASRWQSPQECLNEDVLKIISRKFRGWNNTLPYFFIVQGPLAGFVPYRTQHSVPLTIFQVFFRPATVSGFYPDPGRSILLF